LFQEKSGQWSVVGGQLETKIVAPFISFSLLTTDH